MNGELVKKLQEEIKQMSDRIAELEDFVREKKSQQLTYPLDNPSRQIVQIDSFVPTGLYTGSTVTNTGSIPVSVNGMRMVINVGI